MDDLPLNYTKKILLRKTLGYQGRGEMLLLTLQSILSSKPYYGWV